LHKCYIAILILPSGVIPTDLWIEGTTIKSFVGATSWLNITRPIHVHHT